MELKDFIKNTISSISEAILESQEELNSKGVLVNPEKYEVTESGDKKFSNLKQLNNRHLQTLEFDVLVGIESETGAKGGGKIKVAEILNIAADKLKTETNASQNRIKFEIPIAFSTVETPSKYTGEDIAVL